MPIHKDEIREEVKSRSSGHRISFFYRLSDGVQVCGKGMRNKPPELRCASVVVHPRNGRCKFHGGTDKTGRKATGTNAVGALARLRTVFERSVNDPKLFDMRRVLVAMNAAFERAIDRVEEFDTPKFRKRARELYKEALKANADDDGEEAAKKIEELGKLLDRGAKEDAAFARMVTTAKNLATEQQRAWNVRLSAAQTVNARDLTAILARQVAIVRDELTPKQAAKLIDRLEKEVVPSIPLGKTQVE